MRVKVQARLPTAILNELNRPLADYPLRLSSFLVSAGVHGLAIAALLTVASLPGAKPDRPIYRELIKPHEHKILFYDLRRKVPDVAPLKKVGATKEPRGAELSNQAIIATSKKPISKLVFISVPAPKLEVQEDMPAQLLIARLDTTLPSLPTKPVPKSFVPPPAAKREPKLPIQTPVIETPAPTIASAAPLPLPEVAFSTAATLPRNAPEAPVAHTGNAKADIAVASLHPSPDANTPLPNGERPARFSKAPVVGAAASGDANGTLTVPNLTVRQPKPEPDPPPPSLPRREVLYYAERMRGIPLSTLSVPLRPANRAIPPSVDARWGHSVTLS
jgi:hypothetical protein